MSKQTMGTPCHNWLQQSQTKLFRLQTPATPLFRPTHHDNIGLDNFAMGTNAIVAVISYTVNISEIYISKLVVDIFQLKVLIIFQYVSKLVFINRDMTWKMLW